MAGLQYGQACLSGATAVTTSTVPALSTINSYNATSGALTQSLPALSSFNVGGRLVFEKNFADASYNAVTVTCAGADTFDDGSTTRTIYTPGQGGLPGEHMELASIQPGGTRLWKVVRHDYPRSTWAPPLNSGGLSAIASEFSLSNSTTATQIMTPWWLPAGVLAAGSVYRIKLYGSIQVASTSGTLTFTPFLQNTALNTIQMPTQTSGAGPVGFTLEHCICVRSTGTSGTAIAHGFGTVAFTTPVMLTTTNTSATTINTTTSAGTPAIYVQAQWATASTSNILKVEIATIERDL